MSVFSPDQVSAIRQLRALWKDIRFCLIGATALGFHLDRTWRKTNDIDFTLSVAMNAFPAGLDRLVGWKRHRTREHEWHGPGGVQIDVLPAGDDLLKAGEVLWKSGHRMSLVGMRLAFETAADTPIAKDLRIAVPSLCSLALLKMVAYLDRPHERERDLADLAHVLEEYVVHSDERVYGENIPSEIELERRPSFLFGADLGALVNATERAVVDRFIGLARGSAAYTTRARLLRLGPVRWRNKDDEVELDALLSAFLAGFSPRK